MAMVQSLLVRSLVAWFWDEPLRAPLIRHGANLHGRYLLPHFRDSRHRRCRRRSARARHRLRHQLAGPVHRVPVPAHRHRACSTAWRSSCAARSNRGTPSARSPPPAGTARYVDSSVERIQVRVIGADRQRYIVTCNGYPVPLLATDNPDIQVGGVRFRAWQPPSALHPTITVDGPLRFELVDLATGDLARRLHLPRRRIPGGRAYDSPPVNAVEAESRRGRRFEATGFTPGKVDLVRHPGEAGTHIHRCRRAGHPRPAPGAYRAAVMALCSGRAARDSSVAGTAVDRDDAGSAEPDRAGARREPGPLFDRRRRRHRSAARYDEFVDAAGNVRPAGPSWPMRRRARPTAAGASCAPWCAACIDNDGITYIRGRPRTATASHRR